MSQLLALTGYATCGKSSIADILEEHHGFIRTKFAGPLKDMLRVIGLTHEHLDGKLKHEPCELLCGKSPREAMQTLGTEWGRELIGPGFWTGIWAREARDFLRQGIPVVVDDCRFASEVNVVRSLGGKVIRIYRDGLTAGTHASEFELDRIGPDAAIQNNGSLLELRLEVEKCLALL